MNADSEIIPSIIPVEENQSVGNPRRSRSVFSSGVTHLSKHHIDEDNLIRKTTRKYAYKETSEHLLDDLMRRPLDPMFEDSTLTAHNVKPIHKIMTQIISFILCVAVGISGVQVIRLLQGNSREKLRAELASQVTALSAKEQDIENQVKSQRKEIAELTKNASTQEKSLAQLQGTYTLLGQNTVVGSGVEVTLTNPTLSSPESEVQGRVTDGQNTANVTDTLLQYVVTLLWAGGAEAISINDERLGPQTSIRSAGDTILIGATGIQSPYIVRAIGDTKSLEAYLNNNNQTKQLFKSRRIGFKVSQEGKMQLPPVSTLIVQYAKKG